MFWVTSDRFAKVACAFLCRRLRVLRPLERQPPDYRLVAELCADAIDRVLGFGGAAVNQVGGIGLVGGDQGADADADEAVARAAGFALEEAARGGEDAAGELGRRVGRA